MFKVVKKRLPRPLKDILRYYKSITVDKLYKKYLVFTMQKKHKKLLYRVAGKPKVKVVFLVFHSSTWKVDSVFTKMLKDPFFDPIILVCPYIVYGKDNMKMEMETSLDFFEKKGYPVISSYNEQQKKWVSLKELNTDLVFFTNPHQLTFKEYHENAYLNYLSCYVPYHHEVGSYNNDIAQYGSNFHAAQWKIFSSHKSSFAQFERKGISHNVVITGFPAMESLLEKLKSEKKEGIWKNETFVTKRIIWAPHHSIDMANELPYSSFLQYADFFIELAIKFKEKVNWCFKPHPLLREKLYIHPEWGKERTDLYYEFWETMDFSQIHLSDYMDIFATSDGMIHDCGSFLAEYLYTMKPVLYLKSSYNNFSFYNDFGIKALKSCYIASSKKEIENFILQVIKSDNGKCMLNKDYYNFQSTEIFPYFADDKPSDKIIESIKSGVKNG